MLVLSVCNAMGQMCFFSDDIQDMLVIFFAKILCTNKNPIYDLLGPYVCHSCCNIKNIKNAREGFVIFKFLSIETSAL